MLIVALVLAVVGLAALVTAVITSNELIAWVCIAASVIGVLLLIIDAVRSRSTQADEDDDVGAAAEPQVTYDEDYPEETPVEQYEEAPAEAATTAEGAYDEPAGNDFPKT
ncbi:MAG: DUF308 domain-containing protein [Mycolicibacterium sp.]|uniref:DUF308 domain-containing protein n=1 Tax=Mycolicibacterium sp. TaxID=2320850 RepID=UPI003D0C09EC